MLEFIITFAVILFAGFSVTMGILLGRRSPEQGCHCKAAEPAGQMTASKCGSCQILEKSNV